MRFSEPEEPARNGAVAVVPDASGRGLSGRVVVGVFDVGGDAVAGWRSRIRWLSGVFGDQTHLTWGFAFWMVSSTRGSTGHRAESAGFVCLSGLSVVAELAEGVGELAAQPLVLVGDLAVALVGEFESLP